MIHQGPARLRITQAARLILEKRLGIAQLCHLLAVLLRLYIGQHVNGVFGASALGMAGACSGDGDGRSPVEEIVNMKAEKATGEYNLLIREAFHSHDMIMMSMTSHGQPSIVPKAELDQRSRPSAAAEGFQVARCIDGDILAQACARPSYHSYPHEIPSTHVGRATHKDALRKSGRAYLHEIKVLREWRGSAGNKKSGERP